MIPEENLDEIIALIEELLELDPRNDRAAKQLSMLKVARGDAQPIVAESPLAGVSASRTLAKLYENQGHAAEARRVYDALEIPDAGSPGDVRGGDAIAVLEGLLASIRRNRRTA